MATKTVVQGTSLPIKAKVYHPRTGELLVASDVASASWATSDVADESSIAAGSLTPSEIVASPRPWAYDDEGYNVYVVLPGTAFPTGKVTTQITITLTLTGEGDVIKIERDGLPIVYVSPDYAAG